MATNQQLAFPAAPMVVPAGFRWSLEDIARQEKRNTFLRVGPIRRVRQGANANAKPVRALSGAIKTSWNSQNPEEQQAIFNLRYRITGTAENIRQALTFAGYGDVEINKVIAESITRDNFNASEAQAYNAEVEAHGAHKVGRPQQEGFGLAEINWLADNIRSATFVSSRSGENAGRQAGAGGAPRGGGRTLAGAYSVVANSNNGKVIDVSGIDDTTGTGYKTIDRPKSGKFGVMNIPIVSRSLEKYVRALEIIFGAGAQQQFANEIATVQGSMQAVPRPPVVGQAQGFPQQFAQAGFLAPRPGATIAPAPLLRAAGAPVPAVLSPPKTMGGPAGGMGTFRAAAQ